MAELRPWDTTPLLFGSDAPDVIARAHDDDARLAAAAHDEALIAVNRAAFGTTPVPLFSLKPVPFRIPLGRLQFSTDSLRLSQSFLENL